MVFARRINPAFALAEVIWILAGSDDLSFLSFWNRRMVRYSDDGSTLCGAYGQRLGSRPTLSLSNANKLRHESQVEARLDQIRMAYEALVRTPHSRQIVLQIWDHRKDMPDPLPRSKDVPCNLISHLMIRDGKLEWLQVMRSNDLYWGLPYNFVQFTTLQEIIAGWLGLEVGSYVHISDSLHVYKRHWTDLSTRDLTSASVPKNESDLRVGPYEKWETYFREIVSFAMRLIGSTSLDGILAVDVASNIPLAYREWLSVLKAETLRKHGHLAEALKTIRGAGIFWERSWSQWALTAKNIPPLKQTT